MMRKRRNVPATIVAIFAGVIVSMLAGMLLASYAVAGGTSSYVRAPVAAQAPASVDSDRALTTVQRIAAATERATPFGEGS